MSTYIIEKYTNYAIKNNVFPNDEVPDDDTLIVACNKFHQNYLLNVQNNGLGYKAATKCTNQLAYNPKCTGIYTNGYHYCECGYQWFWNSTGFDPRDVEAFDIENSEPYGYIDRYDVN
jgi:hypothetical protein